MKGTSQLLIGLVGIRQSAGVLGFFTRGTACCSERQGFCRGRLLFRRQRFHHHHGLWQGVQHIQVWYRLIVDRIVVLRGRREGGGVKFRRIVHRVCLCLPRKGWCMTVHVASVGAVVLLNNAANPQFMGEPHRLMHALMGSYEFILHRHVPGMQELQRACSSSSAYGSCKLVTITPYVKEDSTSSVAIRSTGKCSVARFSHY